MSTAKKMIKNSSIYGLVSILQKAIGFFLLPVYAVHLEPVDYGITAVVGAIVSFLSVFYMLSLHASISRFYFDYKDDKEKLAEFWGTNILFIIINSIVMTIILVIFNKFLIQPFAKGVPFYPYIMLGLISITLNPIYSIFQSTLQAEQNGRKYGLNNLSYFIINIVLTIMFVVFFKLQAKGVLLASAITDIIFFIYTLIDFLPKVKLKININYLKKSMKYAFPLIPHSLAGWTMAMIDKLFINVMKTTAAVGIYNIGFQFGNIINILTTAVNQAYVPWFFEKMKDKDEKSIIKTSEYAIVVYGFMAMCISLFAKDVIYIMLPDKYMDAWIVIPFISFAYVFNGVYYFFVNPLFYNRKGTKFVAVGTFASAIFNCILNYLLIPKYDIIGASVASLIANVLASLLILYISSKIEKINFNFVKMYSTAFIFLAISMISFLGMNMSMLKFFFIKVIILIAICGAIFKVYKQECIDLYTQVKNYIKTR